MDKQKFIIDRFDHYYDSINNKGNVFLTLNIFITGGLFTCLTALPNFVADTKWSIILIVLMIALSLLSMLFSLTALIPYTKGRDNSLIYFGDIVSQSEPLFMQRLSVQTQAELIKDLNKQIYALATGLKFKFNRLRIAGILLFIAAIVMVPLIIVVIKNLK